MKRNNSTQHTAEDLRQGWPLKRTLFFCGVTAFLAVSAALRLPLWTAVLPLAAFLLCLLLPCIRHPRPLLLCGTAAIFWICCIGYRTMLVLPLERLAGQSDTLVGWIESCPASGEFYTLRVTEAERVPADSRVLLYCPDVGAPRRGERVTATVTLVTTASHQASYRADGIYLLAFPDGYGEESVTILGEQPSLPLLQRIQGMRDPLADRLRQLLPAEEGALLGALCLGDRQGLSVEMQIAFRNSGLSHLLVVSGLHLSLLTVAVQRLLLRFRLSRRVTAALTVLPVILFMLLIGLTPSVTRAGVMCLVWLVGQMFRRRANGLNSLGIAAMLLLVSDPYMAADPGALLSFFATAGVLCLASRLIAPSGEKRPFRKIAVSLATCLGAMLFVLPLLCYYFGRIPLITPIANLLAVTPATGALLCGWAGLLLGLLPGLSFLGNACLLAAGACAKITEAVTRLCSTYAGMVTISALWQMVLVTGGCALLVFVILRGDRHLRRFVMIGLLLLCIVAGCVDGVLSANVVTVTAFVAGSGMALLVGGDQPTLFLSHSDGLETAAYVLKTRGITHLHSLLLGECLPEHAAHLATLLRQTEATRLFSATPPVWAAGLAQPITHLANKEGLTASYGRWLQDSPARWRLRMGMREIYLYETHIRPTITIPAITV